MTPHDLPFSKRITVDPVTGCWTWNREQTCEYPQTTINKQHVIVHRYVFERVNGYLPPVVQHSCDNMKCCCPEHLQAGTQQSNQADKVAKGRQAKGEQNGRAKLSIATVRQIRAEHAAGKAMHRLAIEHGVCDRTIRGIVNCITWQHAQEAA